MALQKLPEDVQSLFCASQVCSFKRAVEELIYNSLDAGATSIAIRVNIQENSIQVIDNGHGISKTDFNLLGQKHATSKCVDLATLKSTPNKYGFRGLAVASIAEVSKSVKITSRCSDSEETWVKCFYKGSEQKVCKTSLRPSKGTTVDVKGFLYNLKIQKKAIESLQEINDIKNFLEQLSLVHNNISTSLRDDAKNEIVFKLHKNRDIYQTLSSVFEIERKDLQELKVEKGEYKMTAYIGKRDKDASQKRWVYLNGKKVDNSKINKFINDNLSKVLKLNLQARKKVKSKNPFNEEENLNKKGIPFYFVFITCPYYDYDINLLSKQTVVEFKNWEQINKLIQKLIQLYSGDEIKVNNPVQNLIQNHNDVENTRNKVKKIMDKILGSNPRKTGISHMCKGIKGKVTKRKPKKQVTKLTLTKVLPVHIKHQTVEKVNETKLTCLEGNYKNQQSKAIYGNKTNNIQVDNQQAQLNNLNKVVTKKRNKCNIQTEDKKFQGNKKIKNMLNKVNKSNFKTSKTEHPDVKRSDTKTAKNKLVQRASHKNKTKKSSVGIKKLHRVTNNEEKIQKRREKTPIMNNVLKKFEKDPTGSVKMRCNNLARKIDDIMAQKEKRKRKIFINETIQYSNVVKDNKNYSIRKKIGEIVIHDYIPKPIGITQTSYDLPQGNTSSYDLIKTVLKTQEINNACTEVKNMNENFSLDKCSYNFSPKATYTLQQDTPKVTLPKLTYDSHNYEDYFNRTSYEYDSKDHDNIRNICFQANTINNKHLITTKSKEIFLIPSKNVLRRKQTYRSSKFNIINFIKNDTQESSFKIEFSKSNKQIISQCIENPKVSMSMYSPLMGQSDNKTFTIERVNYDDMESRVGSTYTIERTGSSRERFITDNNEHQSKFHNIDESNCGVVISSDANHSTETENAHNSHSTDKRDKINVIFVSKSQEPEKNTNIQSPLERNLIPQKICETVHSQEEIEDNEKFNKMNDSLFNGDLEIDSFLCDRNAYTQRNFPDLMDFDEFFKENSKIGEMDSEPFNNRGVRTQKENNRRDEEFEHCRKMSENVVTLCNRNKEPEGKFNFTNRLRFIPKGMSQIFKNCQTKNTSDYNFDKEYYEKCLYSKFADDVRMNAQIFEPDVPNVKELTTKDVEKVGNRLNKDHASLVFSGDNLKNATVLGQIDNKFIAAKLKGRAQQSLEMAEYLVLFDQHAVHERIRLENNLSEYLYKDQWKSTALDEITLKLSKDEIMYLHNYKDKFAQLGLEWTVSGTNEISIKGIPQAILGKNPRQVEIIMKAVKNLIVEEIYAIKTQSGCISLHPKAIMELVFSEACRYAIKFGDKLSSNDCVDLLNSLADCKTPFQCAHGRPVMAVLMEIRNEIRKYKVNFSSICKSIKSKKKQ